PRATPRTWSATRASARAGESSRSRHWRSSSSSARSARRLAELQERRLGYVSLEDRGDLAKRIVIVVIGVRDDAVGGREQFEAAHVGIVRGEQHADVAGNPRQNQAADAECLEQGVERRAEETGVLRLQYEVVAGERAEATRDAVPWR